MLNLDPALLNQDKIRLHRRKRLIVISIVPVVILFIIALFFIRTSIYNIVLSIDQNTKSYSSISAINNFQKVGNMIEPYLAYYNGGTFMLYNASSVSDLTSAEAEFRESLKNDPPEQLLCDIYVNLSYSIELQADAEMSEKTYDRALVLYNRAEGLLFENNCASKDSSAEDGKDEKANNAKSRIDDKRRKAVAAANDETDDGKDDKDNKKQQQLDDETVEELKNLYIDRIDNAGLYVRGAFGSKYTSTHPKDYKNPNL